MAALVVICALIIILPTTDVVLVCCWVCGDAVTLGVVAIDKISYNKTAKIAIKA